MDSATFMEVFNPLQTLFTAYQRDRAKVENIANSISDSHEALEYFFSAAIVGNRQASISVERVFKLEPAVKAIDAKYWQSAMALTDVLDHMPANKRNDWHESIREHKTPEFTIESVKATLTDMLLSRERFQAERVDGIFKALSHDHVTNVPQGFGKRFIMSYMRSYGSVDNSRANYIYDLRCVIGKLMKRDVHSSYNTYKDLNSIALDGKWNEFDGGAFKIRMYKRGTAHMEVHPSIAWQLNLILARIYPMAIPAAFRTKPKKIKEHELNYDLIGLNVIRDLLEYRKERDSFDIWFPTRNLCSATEGVLLYLGGVNNNGRWSFDYDVTDVIKEMKTYGAIPERKSHQYYPTPENIAIDAVEWAGIETCDTVLEPSAGQGGLAAHFPDDNEITCVEISELHCGVLRARFPGATVVNTDFIKHRGKYDKIIMNPPFSDGRAVDHVNHAATLLNDGGVIVAIMPASNKGKIIVKGMSHEWSEVYRNEFQGCSVNVIILRLN